MAAMNKRAWQAWIPSGFTWAALVLLAANYFSTFGDLDYTWQVRTGQIIVQTGDLQPPDQFSYTIAGRHVPDHEWLYEVVLWLLWDNFGYGGLKLLKCVLVTSTLLLLAWRLRVAGLRWHGIALALTLAVAVLAPAWNLRPLYSTTIGLLLVSGWLHDHCTGRKRLPWALPVVMLVWANCHPAVITGQGLIFGAIAWEWLNRGLKVNAPLSDAGLRRLTLIGGLGLLATFISPDPVGRLLYPFGPTLKHPIQRVFVEMQPLSRTVLQAPYTSGLIYLVAAAVGYSIIRRWRQYRGWEIMMLLGLAFLAHTAARAAQDCLLVMLAVGLPHLVALLRQAALRDRRRTWVAALLRFDCRWRRIWDSPLLRPQWGWLAAAAVLLILVSVSPPLSRGMPAQDADEWPSGALAHLEQHGIGGHFFAPPDYGAYITWKLGDKARCYADTRGFFFPPEYLEDSHYLPQLGPDWQARLEKVLNEYSTDYFMLETTGPRGELWRRLQPEVGSEVIYLDQQTVVLKASSVRDGVRKCLASR
jgi:hypothetical protein